MDEGPRLKSGPKEAARTILWLCPGAPVMLMYPVLHVIGPIRTSARVVAPRRGTCRPRAAALAPEHLSKNVSPQEGQGYPGEAGSSLSQPGLTHQNHASEHLRKVSWLRAWFICHQSASTTRSMTSEFTLSERAACAQPRKPVKAGRLRAHLCCIFLQEGRHAGWGGLRSYKRL